MEDARAATLPWLLSLWLWNRNGRRGPEPRIATYLGTRMLPMLRAELEAASRPEAKARASKQATDMMRMALRTLAGLKPGALRKKRR